MSQLLQFFILIPLVGSLISIFIPGKKEKIISQLAIATVVIHLLGFLGFAGYWLANGHPILDIKHIVFFKAKNIEIFVDFYFDKVTAVYALVGSVLTVLVTVFSRYYIHRDEGFKRYFNTLLLFFLAYNIIVFSGNFETLFIGWEVLGICSFLLIAFYRDRYLPVKNAIKVISIYRLGDIGLILAMWMSHQLWHENITFFKLNDVSLVQSHVQEHPWQVIFIACVILLAAITKSAQFPFSSWLPRAMEGPTSSSAIFYGSLSVHIGVFLLLRTYVYWESFAVIKGLIIGIGIITCFIATLTGRVQSSVKTQIAYSSCAQIGLMFIEVALGFHILALVHFAGNAFLRTYQLLVSPSVLSYLTHDMFFNFTPDKQNNGTSFFNKIRNSFYILSIKEWNMDTFLYRFLWSPFKWIGTKLNFLTSNVGVILLSVIFILGLYCDLFRVHVPPVLFDYFPILFSFIACLLTLRAFAERSNPVKAWLMIIACQLFLALSISLFHEDFGRNYIFIYLSGSVVFSVVGLICLRKIKSLESSLDLNQFHGHSYEYPGLAFVFLISCLGMIGFPFTPTFIGIDILFSHIHKQEAFLIVFISLSFIFMELALLRMYSRIFMGQHKKAYHPIAYRSS